MRRLVLVVTGIAVALVIVIGGVTAALMTGGDGGGGGGGSQEPRGDGGGCPGPISGRSNHLCLFGADPITLDPALSSDASSATYIVEIFSGLVTFDAADPELPIIPDIAKSWKVSDDGTVYTFKLRKGVLFHDASRQVTAEDFKYSMERALDPDTLSTVALVYLGDIVGAREFSEGRADEVRGIRVDPDDPFTLEITIDAPKPYFLSKLTYPTAFVVDRRQVEGNPGSWVRQPNGTGPFRLDEWRLGERIVLEANERYYGEPKPSVSGITFLLAGGSALVMYENDEIDVSGIGVNDIERIRDPSEPLHEEFIEAPEMSTFYIGFNTEKPPFSDPKVRRAFAMSIDKKVLVEKVLKDLVLPAKGVFPPGLPGYNENLKGLPFDPDAARALLEDAGGVDQVLQEAGGKIVLTTSGRGATVGPVLEAIKAMWQTNLGLRERDIKIQQQTDFGIFLQDLDQGEFQMFDLGWIADYVDPQDFADIKFHSDSLNNETRYSNPEVDDLLERARVEQDPQKRLRLYRRAEEIIVQDAPWIMLFHSKVNALLKPYVKGFILAPFVMETLRYVRLEPQ
ncbi:MAG: peptide ABC transporter substrate-binding protein [Chloroflexi bacterium]|nr:peptide ABC transporter substrate-binding protein [Chloroflexota bacterium]